MSDNSATEQNSKKVTSQEHIKEDSNLLAGNITSELGDSNDFVSNESYELLKFHGSYQGYNRDTATERKKQGLDKEYEFMLRLKMPGGRLSARQYLALDELADELANGTLRITTRQTFQYHCIVKGGLKPLIKKINQLHLTTLGGCGDIARNVMSCPAPIKDNRHNILLENTYNIAKYIEPRTGSYLELFLDGQKIDPSGDEPMWVPQDNRQEEEPLYGKHYMPRKFKIGIASPDDNCVDVLTNDLAILPIFEGSNGQELRGYNIAVGGGLGINHNKPETYPRLASPIAFVKNDQLIDAVRAVVELQRDYGDRTNRKHARLKYVIEEQGLDWAKTTFDKYLGSKADSAIAMGDFHIEDHMGWHEQGDGKLFLGIPISSGRILDRKNDNAADENIRTGLYKVIDKYRMDLVLTPDQNIIMCDIEPSEQKNIENMLKDHGIKLVSDITPLYRNLLACVALPTCGKALAEAERIKLPLTAEFDSLFAKYGLENNKIAIRITGCPNGCARPYVGDIGIVGRTPGHYALYIGGDFEGTRLNQKIFDKIPLENLKDALEPMIANYKQNRSDNDEGFGDFAHRYGVENLRSLVQNEYQDAKWVKK